MSTLPSRRALAPFISGIAAPDDTGSSNRAGRRRLGTQEQAARIWGCDVRTIRNRISDGTLTGFKLPGTRAIRVDLNEVEHLLEVIPAAKRQPRQPFGPGAKIVHVAEVAE